MRCGSGQLVRAHRFPGTDEVAKTATRGLLSRSSRTSGDRNDLEALT